MTRVGKGSIYRPLVLAPETEKLKSATSGSKLFQLSTQYAIDSFREACFFNSSVANVQPKFRIQTIPRGYLHKRATLTAE